MNLQVCFGLIIFLKQNDALAALVKYKLSIYNVYII